MADKKISQLTTLAQADVAVTADFLPIVDTSATETKKATPQSVVLGALGATSANVGIGTASPSATLGRNLTINGTNAGTNSGIVLQSAGTERGYAYASDTQMVLGSSTSIPLLMLTGGSERMRLDSSGNLGIGTSSPAYPLQVRRAGGAGSLGVSIDSVGTTDRVVQYFSIQDNASGVGAGHAFYYRAPSSTTDTLGFMLDESGNLGIGTASPSAKLSISSGNIFVDNANGSVIVRNADATNQQQIRVRMSGNDGVLDVTRASGTAPNLIFGTEATERMRLDSSGNLGIGTASPSYRVDVVGASTIPARFKGNGTLSAVILADNNTVTEGYVGSVGDDIRIVAGTQEVVRARSSGSVTAGLGSRATTATDGFLYVPTCAGTPTGTPTAITGFAPIVVDTTNNKMYFYSGGQWRDAGP